MLLTLAIIFWLGFLGLFAWRAYPFLTKSYPDTKPPYRDEEMNSYFTPTMVHNSVGIWRIEDTLNTVEWLDKNVPLNAVVLVDNRYRGLMMTNFKMDNRYIITNTWSERWSQEGLNSARKKGFTKIYLIWKNTSVKGFYRIFVWVADGRAAGFAPLVKTKFFWLKLKFVRLASGCQVAAGSVTNVGGKNIFQELSFSLTTTRGRPKNSSI